MCKKVILKNKLYVIKFLKINYLPFESQFQIRSSIRVDGRESRIFFLKKLSSFFEYKMIYNCEKKPGKFDFNTFGIIHIYRHFAFRFHSSLRLKIVTFMELICF